MTKNSVIRLLTYADKKLEISDILESIEVILSTISSSTSSLIDSIELLILTII